MKSRTTSNDLTHTAVYSITLMQAQFQADSTLQKK
jgi:hypothetical protein